MSQSTRLFSAYITTLSFGGVSYLAVCKSFKVSAERGTGQAEALVDAWEYPVALRGKWSGTGDFFISTAATSGEGGPGGTFWTTFLANTQQALIFKDNSVSGAGNTLAGNGVITSIEENLGGPLEATVLTITLTGQGAITSTIA
jgi:hypothetical protein